jgi:hypothetical protein
MGREYIFSCVAIYRETTKCGLSVLQVNMQFRIKIYKKSYHKHVLFLSTKLQSINKYVHIKFSAHDAFLE